MKKLLKGEFCELTNEEMISISGGMSLKNFSCILGGTLLAAHAPLIGFFGTPAAGVMAFGAGLELLGEGNLLKGGE